jgi:hypothetical protein
MDALEKETGRHKNSTKGRRKRKRDNTQNLTLRAHKQEQKNRCFGKRNRKT